MKTDKIIFWSITGLVSAVFVFSGVLYLSGSPEMIENFKSIGFPSYMIPFLGVAKIAGAIAILNPWFREIKEWAYAGFTFNLLGAAWIHIATNTPFIAPLVLLAVLFTSYYFHRRVNKSVQLNTSLSY